MWTHQKLPVKFHTYLLHKSWQSSWRFPILPNLYLAMQCDKSSFVFLSSVARLRNRYYSSKIDSQIQPGKLLLEIVFNSNHQSEVSNDTSTSGSSLILSFDVLFFLVSWIQFTAFYESGKTVIENDTIVRIMNEQPSQIFANMNIFLQANIFLGLFFLFFDAFYLKNFCN